MTKPEAETPKPSNEIGGKASQVTIPQPQEQLVALEQLGHFSKTERTEDRGSDSETKSIILQMVQVSRRTAAKTTVFRVALSL